MMTPSRLTEYLPGREEIASALGFRQAQTQSMLLGLGLFGAGLLIGSALSLLLTPRSGPEMRDELKSRISSVRDRLRTTGPDGEDRDSARA
jgi:hypothetical protein